VRSCVVVLMFAGLLTACGTTRVGTYPVNPGLGQADGFCAAGLAALDKLARENPSLPASQARAEIEKTCRHPVVIPPAPPEQAVSSPGCNRPEDPYDGAPVPIDHRVKPRPKHPIPSVAARAGSLPADGAPEIAGIQLPAGSRCGHEWATDAPVADAAALASRLAQVFAVTGLWPIVWTDPSDPDQASHVDGDPAGADHVDVARLLRSTWGGFTPQGRTLPPFPGLAPASPGIGSGPDPFEFITSPTEPPLSGGNVLVLVPCNRPADAISAMGFSATEEYTNAELTAVVRSWEERFGAVLTTADQIGLSIESPPRSERQVVQLAAEQDAFAPDGIETEGTDGLYDLMDALVTGKLYPTTLRTTRHWSFSWAD
jgi:hypothetical protein